MPAIGLDLVGEHLGPAGEADALGHPVVGGVGHQDPIALVDIAQENVEHRLPDPGRDDDLAVRVILQAEIFPIAMGNRRAQLGQSV